MVSRAALLALASLLAACSERRRTPAPVTAEPRPSASAPAPPSAPPQEAPPAPPPPAAAASTASGCGLHVGKVEFLECNEHPKQFDYPECWQYLLEPVQDDHADPDACLPAQVTLGVGGWGGVNEGVLAKVVYKPARPREATLVLKEGSTMVGPYPAKPGAVVGTLVFKDGEVSALRFGPGMRSQTGKAVMEVTR